MFDKGAPSAFVFTHSTLLQGRAKELHELNGDFGAAVSAILAAYIPT
jgi:hypothetical protein